MRLLPRWFGLILWLLAAVPVTLAQSVQVIPNTNDLVTDRGDLLTPTQERALRQKLLAYEDTTSTQIAVVTLPSLDGVPASMYATELGQQWGVGQRGQDNGAVLLVSRDDREVFIATGYGLEGAIPDAIASRIVRNILLPNFRQGDFYGGIDAGVDALVLAARGEFQATPSRTPSGGGGGDFGLFGFILLIVIWYFLLKAMRKRPGGGPGEGGGRRHRRGPDLTPFIIWGSSGGSGGWGGGGGFGGGGFGGFGGGGFGGGGAGGSW